MCSSSFGIRLAVVCLFIHFLASRDQMQTIPQPLFSHSLKVASRQPDAVAASSESEELGRWLDGLADVERRQELCSNVGQSCWICTESRLEWVAESPASTCELAVLVSVATTPSVAPSVDLTLPRDGPIAIAPGSQLRRAVQFSPILTRPRARNGVDAATGPFLAQILMRLRAIWVARRDRLVRRGLNAPGLLLGQRGPQSATEGIVKRGV